MHDDCLYFHAILQPQQQLAGVFAGRGLTADNSAGAVREPVGQNLLGCIRQVWDILPGNVGVAD